MSTYVFAFLIGVIAGLRSLTAPAALVGRLAWVGCIWKILGSLSSVSPRRRISSVCSPSAS